MTDPNPTPDSSPATGNVTGEDTATKLDRGSSYRTPRWVKILGIITIVLILIFIITGLAGMQHGPGLHNPTGNAGGQAQISRLIQDYAFFWPDPVGQSRTMGRLNIMLMRPGVRKFTLAVHLAFSVGWIGAVVVYLVLVITAMNSQDDQTLRAAWLAMELSGRFAIVPLALASLLTGIIISIGTKWGLFRHYWVLISLLLTILATAVLLEHMQTVSFLAGSGRADAAQNQAATAHEDMTDMVNADASRLRSGLPSELFHAGVGLLVLLVVQVLNVYKPQGMTPYGWRKRHEQPRVPVL